jgi:hypothetical protein
LQTRVPPFADMLLYSQSRDEQDPEKCTLVKKTATASRGHERFFVFVWHLDKAGMCHHKPPLQAFGFGIMSGAVCLDFPGKRKCPIFHTHDDFDQTKGPRHIWLG